jgi:hypothetical protein
MSNPITGYLVANNLANGNPTYPNPITAILVFIKILSDCGVLQRPQS